MNVSEKWRQVPRPVKLFLLKGTVLFIAWKLLYLGVLLPNRVLDRPLTRFIGLSTTATLNWVNRSSVYSLESGVDEISGTDHAVVMESVERLYRNKDKVLSIADVCNGLELMVLYAGFILIWPGSRARKIKFIAGGLALIVVLNIIRCAALAFIYLHKPESVDFYHHYLFTFLIYGFIFWLWYLFTLRPGSPPKSSMNAAIEK